MGLEDVVYVGSRPNFEAHGANCIGLDAVEIMEFSPNAQLPCRTPQLRFDHKSRKIVRHVIPLFLAVF